jgi:hypothetical protein
MCSEEMHQKSSEARVVQSDWLPKCYMKTGNNSSAAKDFSSEKSKLCTSYCFKAQDTSLESSLLAPFWKSRKVNVLSRR